MTSSFARWLASATMVASLLVAACGGGGGGSSPPTTGGGGNNPPTQGIDGVGAAVGPITGFGSVYVNGVRFDTAGAQVRIDDNPGVESDLQVGQVVTVKGRFNADGTTGTADSVSYNDAVEGPVGSVDLVAGTLVVLGQTVRVTASTVFDDRFATPSLAGVAVGSVVEVSGYPNASGEIVATRIEPKAVGGTFELYGVVSGLSGTRFSVNSTLVDYASAQLPNGSPTNGACVEVKGSSYTGGILNASRVEVKSCGLTVANGDRGQVEGIITRFASASDFDVGAVRVATSSSTTYERGVAADLRLNLKVEVEGTFDANRTLVARKVQIKPDNSTRLLGTVDAIDSQARSVTIFGARVLVDAGTALEDKSSADLRPFGFADLRTGDYLEVRGFEESTAGTMRAVLIEREDLDSRRELQGRATDVASPGLRILGVTVTTDGATEFRDASDLAITGQQFFQQASNRLVKVRGSWDGTAFRATRAELEN